MFCRSEAGEKMQREERGSVDLPNCMWTGEETAMDFGQAREGEMKN